jgi:hypothetical protein
MNKIAQFEALAEKLVEGTFAHLFAERLSPLEVARHLTRAIEDHRTLSSNGPPKAPAHYSVYLNPKDHKALRTPSLEQELAHHVTELASQAGIILEHTPVVRVVSDEGTACHNVRVSASWTPEDDEPDVEKTREMQRDELDDLSEKTRESITSGPKGRPFLILEGHRHVDLRQSVVSIGRALDNDIIIEDPRVSRHHAQLRQRYRHYVLYDLGSSGGTKINDYPVEECVLHSGDIISFAGVQVIYGEDPPTPVPLPESEDTIPFDAEST